jgi:hypothetical protein
MREHLFGSVAMNLQAGGDQVAHRARRVGTGMLTGRATQRKRLVREGYHGPFWIKK